MAANIEEIKNLFIISDSKIYVQTFVLDNLCVFTRSL